MTLSPATVDVRIPFNRPSPAPREADYVAQVLASVCRSGDGPFSRRCQTLLEESLGADRVLLTSSGTDALEMGALLLDLQPGDEVVVPAFTFVSTANAFALRGARIVFADVRPDTLNLDEASVERLITPRTRAVVAVHYAGVACEMDPLGAICARQGVDLLEDNAHGLFGGYRGRKLGALGRWAALSFHETKNISCGEGGALVINDATLARRAEILRDKGTNRAQFYRGLVDKYTWVDLGSSFLPSDILAAVLLAQLEQAQSIQERRERIWRMYDAELAAWSDRSGTRRPVVPEHCRSAWHMYHLVMPTQASRDGLIDHLRERGILAVFHYHPLNTSPMGAKHGGRRGQCPVAEEVADRLIRLPFFHGMDAAEQDAVIDAVTAFRP